MRATTRIFLLCLALCAALISCKKGDEPDPDNGNNKPDEPTAKELISKVWKVDEVQINGVKDQTSDYSAYRFEFKSDGTYKFKLDTEAEGTWELASNNQKLILDKDSNERTDAQVLTLKEKRLDLEFTVNSTKTGTRKILFRLKP